MIELPCPLCGARRFSVLYQEQLDGAEDAFHYLTERPCHYRIVRCTECEQVYSTPIFSQDKILALYQASRIDAALGEAAARAIRANMRRYLRRLQRDSGFKTGRLLDIGCGLGHLIAEACLMGYNAIGIDPSEEAVAYAARQLGESSAVCAQYRRELFPPASFDLITLVHVIDHVVEPAELLQSMCHHLRPGGFAFIATHNIDSLLARISGKNFIAWSVQHIAYFTPATLRSMAARAGLTPVSTRGSLTTYPLGHFAENGIRNPQLRRAALGALQTLHLSDAPISFPFGNLELICRKGFAAAPASQDPGGRREPLAGSRQRLLFTRSLG